MYVVTIAKIGLVMSPLRPSIYLSVCNILGMQSLCNMEPQNCSFLFVQTLHNDCSHIEDVHLFLCTLNDFFLHFRGVLYLDIFSSEMLRGCLVRAPQTNVGGALLFSACQSVCPWSL